MWCKQKMEQMMSRRNDKFFGVGSREQWILCRMGEQFVYLDIKIMSDRRKGEDFGVQVIKLKGEDYVVRLLFVCFEYCQELIW